MDDRRDLAALVVPLGRRLLAMETPILDRHAIPMWGYIVLTKLADAPIRGQATLAESIGADKSRLIDVLDDLQEKGLIRRDRDPADRRASILAITTKGERLRDRVQRSIRREEERLLARLPAAERESFVRALEGLTASGADD